MSTKALQTLSLEPALLNFWGNADFATQQWGLP
jgi:hypothetical protein